MSEGNDRAPSPELTREAAAAKTAKVRGSKSPPGNGKSSGGSNENEGDDARTSHAQNGSDGTNQQTAVDGKDAEGAGQVSDGVAGRLNSPGGTDDPSSTNCAPSATCDKDSEAQGGRAAKRRKGAKSEHDEQHVLCPRCHSDATKFCYYNNYNTMQPRYFCKDCQRYWTVGGNLRNVPPGSGRRKPRSAAAAKQPSSPSARTTSERNTTADTDARNRPMAPYMVGNGMMPFTNMQQTMSLGAQSFQQLRHTADANDILSANGRNPNLMQFASMQQANMSWARNSEMLFQAKLAQQRTLAAHLTAQQQLHQFQQANPMLGFDPSMMGLGASGHHLTNSSMLAMMHAASLPSLPNPGGYGFPLYSPGEVQKPVQNTSNLPLAVNTPEVDQALSEQQMMLQLMQQQAMQQQALQVRQAQQAQQAQEAQLAQQQQKPGVNGTQAVEDASTGETTNQESGGSGGRTNSGGSKPAPTVETGGTGGSIESSQVALLGAVPAALQGDALVQAQAAMSQQQQPQQQQQQQQLASQVSAQPAGGLAGSFAGPASDLYGSAYKAGAGVSQKQHMPGSSFSGTGSYLGLGTQAFQSAATSRRHSLEGSGAIMGSGLQTGNTSHTSSFQRWTAPGATASNSSIDCGWGALQPHLAAQSSLLGSHGAGMVGASPSMLHARMAWDPHLAATANMNGLERASMGGGPVTAAALKHCDAAAAAHGLHPNLLHVGKQTAQANNTPDMQRLAMWQQAQMMHMQMAQVPSHVPRMDMGSFEPSAFAAAAPAPLPKQMYPTLETG